MKTCIQLGLAFVLAASLQGATGIGDTYEQVIQENGQPSGRMQAGDVVILRYAEQTIKLKAGKVVSVDAKAGGAAVARSESAEPSASPAAHGSSTLAWTTNYRAALAQAKKQDRHVFLFFTGSDWCGWCMKLNKEILTTAEFMRYAQEKLVLVEIDFPRGKSQSAELKEQNATLQKIFEIEGYPTVVVLDKMGHAVGRLNYQEGGPGPFVKALKAL